MAISTRIHILDNGCNLCLPLFRLQGRIVHHDLGTVGDHATLIASLAGSSGATLVSHFIGAQRPNPWLLLKALNSILEETQKYTQTVVINLSVEISWRDVRTRHAALMLEFLIQQGHIIVTAAGNRGQPALEFPQAIEGVVVVGAIDVESRWWICSNYGPNVTISAVGKDVTGVGKDGRVITDTGTSYACPRVASRIAQIIYANPSFKGKEIIRILKSQGIAGRIIDIKGNTINLQLL